MDELDYNVGRTEDHLGNGLVAWEPPKVEECWQIPEAGCDRGRNLSSTLAFYPPGSAAGQIGEVISRVGLEVPLVTQLVFLGD